MRTRRRYVLALCALFSIYANLPLVASEPGQTPVPVTVGVPAPTPPKLHLETEIITIAGGEATPSEINRPSGKFFLAVNSRTANPAAASVLQLLDGAGTVAANALDLDSLQRKRISIILMDLPPGDYQLRASRGMRVLCQIHIR